MFRRGRRSRQWLAGYAQARTDFIEDRHQLEQMADTCRHHACLIVGEVQAWERNMSERGMDAKRDANRS